MLAGAVTHGLFFLSAMGLLCTLAWAIVETFDRLTGTLDLFNMPRAAALGTLAVLYILASILHLCGVLHVHTLLPRTRRDRHPAFMGLASLLVPGWGQMLNGCYGRGTLFLASLWSFGAGFSWATANLMAASSADASSPASDGVRRCQSPRSGKYGTTDVCAAAVETSTATNTREDALRRTISASHERL